MSAPTYQLHPSGLHPQGHTYHSPAAYVPGPPPAGFPPPPPPPPGYGGYPTAEGGYVYEEQQVGPVPQEQQYYAGEYRPPPPMPAPTALQAPSVVSYGPPAVPAPASPPRAVPGMPVYPAGQIRQENHLRPIVDMKVMDVTHPETGRNLVKVMQVQNGGAAQKAGIRPGDIIMAFNKVPVQDSADYVREVAHCAIGEAVVVQTSRSTVHSLDEDATKWCKPGTFSYPTVIVRGTQAPPKRRAVQQPARGEYAQIGW